MDKEEGEGVKNKKKKEKNTILFKAIYHLTSMFNIYNQLLSAPQKSIGK